MGWKVFDLSGKRFGRLTALYWFKNRKRWYWACECDCGAIVPVDGQNLRKGVTNSCGCLSREVARKESTTHGKSGTTEHRSWKGLKGRCLNERHRAYADYGGRGITVCDRWLHSFENFLADMGERPHGTSLDRIDNDGPYSPDNCRWATRSEQARNKRSNRRLTYGNVTMTATEWAERLGVKSPQLGKYLGKGYTIEDVAEGRVIDRRRNRHVSPHTQAVG